MSTALLEDPENYSGMVVPKATLHFTFNIAIHITVVYYASAYYPSGMTSVKVQAVSTSTSLSPKTFFTVPDILKRGCGILRECLSMFSSYLHVHYHISVYAIPHILFTFFCSNVINTLTVYWILKRMGNV